MTVNKTWGNCITTDLAKRWVFMQKAEIATHPCKGHNGIRQVATGSYEDRDGSFGQAARTRQGSLSRSDRDRYLCHDGPENAAYRAVTFSGSEPEFEREKGLAWDCVPT
ncbi:hypothetical protein Taro_044086 [Colocasia esculenta]|uniref:Uncharacterized protein n=1 Tax=Colocasia esculenta TaxID=4460 RepID=A0A843WKZ4_COLES|nr:hypothetical protein [Colocasia esculenta]